MNPYMEKYSDAASSFTKKLVNDPPGHLIWPVSKKITEVASCMISTGIRRYCQYRLDYDVHYTHEFYIELRFKEIHFYSHWYNTNWCNT